jgi:CheY-like chemotaxis protein
MGTLPSEYLPCSTSRITLPRTVLLADDSVTAQNMGRRILTDAGYEVITVNNGSAALKKIHENHPDLIVLDVYMPGYGGLEVCQRLKESGETMRIPVLLSVGKMEPFKAEEAKRVRADAHIVKPFEASELLSALAKLEDRIVPQAESSRGRKSKPSFWHEDNAGGDSTSDPQKTEAKQKTNNAVSEPERAQAVEDVSVSAEGTPKVGAFPLVREAGGEMPVIAATGIPEPDEAAAAVSAPAVDTAPADRVDEKTPATTAEAHFAGDPPAGSDAAAEFEAPALPATNVRWIAENVALTPEEAALELEDEMRAAELAQAATEVNLNPNISGDEPPISAQEDHGATFAAAAGAGVSAVSSAGSRNDDAEPPLGAESSAAWENWQSIRDKVMNAQGTAAIAETVVQAITVTASEDQTIVPSAPSETSATASVSEPPSAQYVDAGALATLVDSVLAELKPKLMEEIAKKLKK